MDPARRLLDLQALDTTIDRLVARDRALTSGTQLRAVRERADEAEGAFGELRLRLDVFGREASTLEHEIDTIGRKVAAEEQRLYDGSVANAKELESIQHEVTNLRRRISDREDELLALMEQREAVEVAARQAETGSTELRAEVERVAAESSDETARIAVELEAARASRATLAGAIDADLLDLYEDLRAQKKGVGAAALVDGVCQGCHEQLSAVELDKLKHADGVRRCEYCRRILVL